MARVAAIWRYPVKSMLGESLGECEVGPAGIPGDRAFALVDAADGQVASAKNPRKWGVLMACRAALVDPSVVAITLPDGGCVRSDDPAVDDVLSDLVRRPVHLRSVAPEDRAFEEVWPDIDGLAPDDVITSTTIGTEDDGERISRLPLGMLAPEGTFFDLSVLHVLTTATLERLRELAPAASFDARRYRPNLLVDVDGEAGFVENHWVGRTLAIGDGARVSISMATMRCVMTTLAQDDLPRDRETLRTIAANNRVEIPGLGTWACAGVYGDTVAPGVVRVGSAVAVV